MIVICVIVLFCGDDRETNYICECSKWLLNVLFLFLLLFKFLNCVLHFDDSFFVLEIYIFVPSSAATAGVVW